MKDIVFATVNLPPFLNVVTEGNVTCVGGIIEFFITTIISQFKGRYRLVDTRVNGLGHQVSPGNWTGAMGMLVRKEADVLGCVTIMIPETYAFIDFGTAIGAFTYSVLSGPPAYISKQSVSISSTMTIKLWITLVMSWLVVSILYYIANIVVMKMTKYFDSKKSIFQTSLVDSLLTFYGLLFQRGFSHLPVNIPLRLLVSGWLFMVVVLMTLLAGTLSSRLVVSDQPTYIDRIEDILKYPKIKPYTPKGLSLDTYLKESEIESIKGVWKQIERYNGVRHTREFFQPRMLDEISRGDAVAISHTTAILPVMVTRACKIRRRVFHIAENHFLSTTLSVGVRKGLDKDVLEILNRAITRYAGMGFLVNSFDSIFNSARPCLEMGFSQKKASSVSLRDMFQVFQFLGIGIIISTAVFMIELHKMIFHREK